MSAIHTESAAIFGHKNVNVAEERIQYVDYKPVNPIQPNTQVEFVIPGTDNRYISLKDSILHAVVEFRITKETAMEMPEKPRLPANYTGTQALPADRAVRSTARDSVSETIDAVAAGDGGETSTSKRVRRDERGTPAGWSHEKQMEINAEYDAKAKAWLDRYNERYLPDAYPIDAIFHTMWNGADVYMNHTLVSTTNTMYAYKSYFETVLNNSSATKEFQLHAIGFTGNRNNKPNVLDPDTESNPWQEVPEVGRRKQLFPLNKQHDILGYLSSDIWGCAASIVNGVQIGIKLYPNKDSFRLMTFPRGTEAEMILKDITLRVCKKTMSPEVIIGHNETMKDTNDATYPFIRTEVRSFTAIAGTRFATIENPYQSNIPARLIFGMVCADSKAGNFQSNPLRFQHFNISSAGFYVNDEPVPRRPYSLNPADGKFLEPFMELYSILGKMGQDKDIGLTREQYLNANFLIPFDVQPTASGNLMYLAKRDGGHCRIELMFSEPLPCNICIVTYAIFPSTLAIDYPRNVKVVDLEKPTKIYVAGDKKKIVPQVIN